MKNQQQRILIVERSNMEWMQGREPKRKPRWKCKACEKNYIPSEQIEIRCGYFWAENPFCKECIEKGSEFLNQSLQAKKSPKN